jgi:predicted porin
MLGGRKAMERMRLSLVLLLLCVAMQTSAAADVDVQLFGKLYASIDVYGDLAAGDLASDDSSKVTLRSGGMSPAYVGLKAGATFTPQESLTLYVESLTNLVDFTFVKQGIGDRRAQVMLATRWGNLSAGRQFTPHLWFMGAEIDAFNLGFDGSPYVLIAGGQDLMLRTRDVMYESPRLFGVGGEVMVSRDAHSAADGTTVGGNDVHLKLDFRSGDFYAGVVYVDQQEFKRFPHRQVFAGGGEYDDGRFGATAAVQRIIGHDGVPSFVDIVAGLKYHAGKHQLLGSAALSRSDDGTRGGQVYAIAYSFAMTSQFTLYTSVAWLGNEPASQLSMTEAVAVGGSVADIMAGARLRLGF